MARQRKTSKRPDSRKNPLAQARGHQKTPENVWFRRSGAGFRLFVEYYAHQPVGVVVANAGRGEDDATTVSSTTSNLRKSSLQKRKETSKKGMSRAAKRRRKRKSERESEQGPDTTDTSINKNKEQVASSIFLTEDTMFDDFSPLVKAAQTYCNKFLDAYQARRLMPFFCTMSRPLPTTFRIRQSVSDAERDELREKLDTFGPLVSPVAIQPAHSRVPQLFQCPLSKAQLSTKAPELKEFLLSQSQNGTLARQELGSMLPILVLTNGGYLKRGHCVVDMCASPGSKTLQAVEQVVVDVKGKGTKGLVLANDVLESRLDALRAAVKRSGIPESYTKQLRYSQVDATSMSLSSPCDVVICDVPCSGDGTCRKDPHILPIWKPQAANALHQIQLAILKRSLDLVKVGGVVCYSTCSLNPVEDEAVVAAALTSSGGTIELLDITGLKGWKRRPGVTTWKVAHYVEGTITDRGAAEDDELPALTWYSTSKEAKREMPEAVSTMFANDAKIAQHLERCARLLPEDYDSGGFFVALLQKCK